MQDITQIEISEIVATPDILHDYVAMATVIGLVVILGFFLKRVLQSWGGRLD